MYWMLRRPVTGTQETTSNMSLGVNRLGGLVEICKVIRIGVGYLSNRIGLIRMLYVYVRTSECITVSARIDDRIRQVVIIRNTAALAFDLMFTTRAVCSIIQ